MTLKGKTAVDYGIEDSAQLVYLHDERICPRCQENTILTKKACTCQNCQVALWHYRIYIHAWLENRFGPYTRRPTDKHTDIRDRIRENLRIWRK